jgi:hypothetical protein
MLSMTQSLLALTRSRADSSSSTRASPAPVATAATCAMLRLAPWIVTTGSRNSATIRFTSSRWLPDRSSAALPQFRGSALGGAVDDMHRPSPFRERTRPVSHSIVVITYYTGD